ncbi:N-6 DNA methylase [Streptosporangium lutulentum]
MATLLADVAELMVELSSAGGGTVFDPTCGLGTLLMSAADAGAASLAGQERDEAAARITAVRLSLHGRESTVHTGDSSVRTDSAPCRPTPSSAVLLRGPRLGLRGTGQ